MVACLLAGTPAAAVPAGRERSAAADTVVALPDLATAHRLPGGGMNLWRTPLSELEDGYGQPQLVRTLDTGGFSYDRSVTLGGDFGDITPSDDGTTDFLIWHAQPGGGVLLWAVGGGGDTEPRLWQDLRTGGWSWADSRPLVGDFTGDGWDDLLVRHRMGAFGTNIWVFPSDGQRLGAPEIWSTHEPWLDSQSYTVGDLVPDAYDDLLRAFPATNTIPYLLYTAVHAPWTSPPRSSGTSPVFTGSSRDGWSWAASRQLAGDVTGDGVDDVVTVHAQPGGGVLVWMHRGCVDQNRVAACSQDPVVWQDLRTGGWSFVGSRQHLADTDADGILDLVSVHAQSGNPGLLVWRHVSTGHGLLPPEVVSDLRAGGWSYQASRAGVADTYGVLVG